MRILLLTQWFDPEPTFKGLVFAKELVARGHEVHVLTGIPNYPEGRVYQGYKIRLFKQEVVDGIPIIRVALFPSHDRSPFRRVLNYVSFALSAALFGPFLANRVDVAYVYHPPPTIGLAAIVLKWFRGIPFVYDIQDLWPDTLAATGMVGSKAVLGLVGAWCKLVYGQASKIAVLSPGFKRRLTERGVPADKIEIIYNWCDEANIRPVPRAPGLARRLGMEGKFIVVFAGNMGEAQALNTVLAAAELLRESQQQVQFVLIGSGTEVERLKNEATRRELTNVLFLPRRPISEIASILGLADLLLVHLKDDPLFEITVPSKIQAYLFMGKPIVAAVSGDASDLILEAGAGVTCAPGSPGALCDAIERLYRTPAQEREAMGRRGRDYYIRELSMAVGAARFESIFLETARGCS